MPYSRRTTHAMENTTPRKAKAIAMVLSSIVTMTTRAWPANDVSGQPWIQHVKSRVRFEGSRARVIDVDADRDIATIAPLLADDAARAILEATATEARSAEELAEHCGVSTPTIYRRLEELREADLVDERTEPDADGHHYTVYRATLDTAVVELTEEGFDVRLTRRDRMADRFTKFVEDI